MWFHEWKTRENMQPANRKQGEPLSRSPTVFPHKWGNFWTFPRSTEFVIIERKTEDGTKKWKYHRWFSYVCSFLTYRYGSYQTGVAVPLKNKWIIRKVWNNLACSWIQEKISWKTSCIFFRNTAWYFNVAGQRFFHEELGNFYNKGPSHQIRFA
jgi:hypothetical protein